MKIRNSYLKCVVLLFFTFIYIFYAHTACAEIFSGVSEYVMEDSETIKHAQEAAYTEAMRSITEQAGVYVKSKSYAKNFQITNDEVEVIAVALLKVEEKNFIKEIMSDGKIKIKAVVRGSLDEAVTDKALNDKIAELKAKENYEKSLAEHENLRRQKENLEKKYNDTLRYTQVELLEEAKTFYKNKDYLGAVGKCNAFIEQHLDYADAYTLRGEAYLELRKYDNAAKDFEKAIGIEPKNAGAIFGKAMIFEHQRKNKEAIKHYRLFIEYANIAKDGEKITKALKRIAKLEK